MGVADHGRGVPLFVAGNRHLVQTLDHDLGRQIFLAAFPILRAVGGRGFALQTLAFAHHAVVQVGGDERILWMAQSLEHAVDFLARLFHVHLGDDRLHFVAVADLKFVGQVLWLEQPGFKGPYFERRGPLRQAQDGGRVRAAEVADPFQSLLLSYSHLSSVVNIALYCL